MRKAAARTKAAAKLRRKSRSRPNPASIDARQHPGDTDLAAVMARTVTAPEVQSASSLYPLNAAKTGGKLTANSLRNELEAQIAAVQRGDLSRAEALLVAQAHTLDAVFGHYIRSGLSCQYLHEFEAKMKLALRAQSQCRATLETLAAIKNPTPPVFVRQANVAHGPQQVNNGTATPGASTPSRAHAQGNAKEPNKLLEHQHAERLDLEATRTPSAADPALEAVAAVNRS